MKSYLYFLLIGLMLTMMLSRPHAQIVEFDLVGPLIYQPSYDDWGIWNVGNEFTLNIHSPVLKMYLKEWEGKKVKITISVVGK